MSGAVRPGVAGTSKPHSSLNRAAFLIDRTRARERSRVGAHLGATLDAGVTADRHQPALVAADEALVSARLTIARTVASPYVCWVTPMLQTKTAVFAPPTSSPKVRIWAVVVAG